MSSYGSGVPSFEEQWSHYSTLLQDCNVSTPTEQEPREHGSSNEESNEKHEAVEVAEQLLQDNKGDIPKTQQQSRRGEPSILYDWWLWELLGTALSLGATVAIIVILALWDGRPLSSWPYKVTLNTMLSVLSTIAKVYEFGTLHYS